MSADVRRQVDAPGYRPPARRRATRRLLREFDTYDRAFAPRQTLRETAWQIRDAIAACHGGCARSPARHHTSMPDV